jgi:predicted RNA-binding Zn-ribbon protein involved in translation (DUF1610 family)
MSALFGPSADDLEHLRATVQSLGTTSVPGLSAALSWRERKTEKVLAHELARPGSPIAYEPARRLVRWAKAPPAPAPPPPAPDVLAPGLARAPGPIPPTQVGGAFKTLCPTCHVPLIPSGSGSLAVCPQCGRLASARTSAATPAAPPAATAPRSAPAPGAPSSVALTDRRAQEMFAAYVTSRPIPCPKCRTPLRHHGVSEYACPSCGQQIRFPKPGGAGAPVPPTAPVAPPAAPPPP